MNGSHLAIGVAAALAAVGALSRRGSSSRVDANLLNQVKDEASELSRTMQSIQVQYYGARNEDIRLYHPVAQMRFISERMKSTFPDRNFSTGSFRIVTMSKVDPRLVIKLNPVTNGDDNLFEAAAYRNAGPKTRACLVPVLAHSREGAWLIMEYAEPASDLVWPMGPCSRHLKALGFRDVVHKGNLTEDGRILDYAERVRTRGSATRP